MKLIFTILMIALIVSIGGTINSSATPIANLCDDGWPKNLSVDMPRQVETGEPFDVKVQYTFVEYDSEDLIESEETGIPIPLEDAEDYDTEKGYGCPEERLYVLHPSTLEILNDDFIIDSENYVESYNYTQRISYVPLEFSDKITSEKIIKMVVTESMNRVEGQIQIMNERYNIINLYGASIDEFTLFYDFPLPAVQRMLIGEESILQGKSSAEVYGLINSQANNLLVNHEFPEIIKHKKTICEVLVCDENGIPNNGNTPLSMNSNDVFLATSLSPDYNLPSEIELQNLTLKEQVQKGWAEKDLTCKDNKVLAFKVKDHSPVCLYPETKEKLLERGIIELSMRDSGFDFSTYEIITPLDGVYFIDYAIKGATINKISQGGMPYVGLVVKIIPEKAGELFIDVPRDIFERYNHDSSKISFIVLNDGEEIKHQLIENKDPVKMSFEFGKYDTRFEIIGMSPPFGVEKHYENFFKENISKTCPVTLTPENSYSYDEKNCKWLVALVKNNSSEENKPTVDSDPRTVIEPIEIIILLDREEVFYGHDGINLVAAFPIGTVLEYDVVNSNNESVWPYHTLHTVHYSHVPIGFDKGTASIGTYQLDPGEYTVVVSTTNSTKTAEFKKSFTILDSKCCSSIDIGAQSDVFIPGDNFQIYVNAAPETPLIFNLIEPNGKITQTKQITTNNNGEINNEYFLLSRIATPGIWTLEAKSKTNSDIISLLVVPTPNELIKKSPTTNEILASYDNELANKKSGYDVLLASSLESFEDDGREYRHMILEHYPAPTMYSDMIKYGWIDTTGFETNEFGIITYLDESHEKYSLNSKKGFYLEDWLPDNIPEGQKLLYAQTGYSTYEKNGLINEQYSAHYNFVPINFVVDENTTSYDLEHNMGFRISISYDSWQDDIEDILEEQKERHAEKSGNYGGYKTMLRDGEMIILFEGGYTGRHYENSIYWIFDDNYSISVRSHYYTLDELIPIFESIMK